MLQSKSMMTSFELRVGAVPGESQGGPARQVLFSPMLKVFNDEDGKVWHVINHWMVDMIKNQGADAATN